MSLKTEAFNFLIVGKKNSGKSMTGWSVLQSQQKHKRAAFFYMCPRPDLLKKAPFQVTNITQFNQLFNLKDSVCLIDEANLFFDVKNKTINQDLKQLLQLSRQNNMSFIFVVHSSYVFNRSLFNLLDVIIIKEVTENHWELERPHMKKQYRSTRVCGHENIYIDSPEIRGYAKIKKLEWFTDEFSKMFRTSEKLRTLFSD